MINAVIVDDDFYSRKLIIENIIDNFEDITIVAEADSVHSCLQVLTETTPDLVFLDIELPDGKGFDIFNHITNIPFKVIFITGHKDYAFDAIKCAPLDYLVKPISRCDLHSAVLKALQYFAEKNSLSQNAGHITQCNDKIIIRTSESIYFVQKEKIIRCEADKNYTTIYQVEEKSILVSRTLKDFELLLPPPNFIRIHQSHLINVNFIKRIEKQESRIQLIDNSYVPIASRKHDLIKEYVSTIPTL
jgi:two-component system LytT family response regulator